MDTTTQPLTLPTPPPPDVSFSNMNSLIYRQPAHKILNLKAGDKNLQLKFIILNLVETITTKKGERITKFLIADGSAAMHFNIFGEQGAEFKEADICYVNGVYCSLYQERPLLYLGKGMVRRLGRYFFGFDARVNISENRVVAGGGGGGGG